MKRKFLEDLGIEKEVIDKIMDEHGVGVTAAKADVHAIEAERDDLKSKYEAAEQTITTLKAAETANEALQNTIKDHEATINKLQTDSDVLRKEFTLKEQLTALGVKDPDYVIFKQGGVDKFSYDQNGKIVGLEETIKPLKESAAYLFNTGIVETNYNPASGEGFKGVNPFAKDTFNLTEQGNLFKTNPAQAKALAEAAGVKI